MLKKICPHCGRASYSSVSATQVWDCPYCGKPFEAVEGEVEGRKISPHAAEETTSKAKSG